MTCSEGQAILGKVKFKNGATAKYNRPYLVVATNDDGVYIVDVSSTEGKEEKLLYDTNYELNNYNPPFLKPSFIKLDSIRYVKYSDLENCHILCSGKKLNEEDLSYIDREVN